MKLQPLTFQAIYSDRAHGDYEEQAGFIKKIIKILLTFAHFGNHLKREQEKLEKQLIRNKNTIKKIKANYD